MEGRIPPPEANQNIALNINTTCRLESIKDKCNVFLNKEPPPNPTIFKVPASTRSGNLHAYEPKLVSIGPYHRDKSKNNLRAMEELKWRLLHHYLSIVPERKKEECLEERKIKDLEERARYCYSEVIDLSSDEFIEMLLLDGCLIVQIFITIFDPEALKAEELRSLLFGNMWFLAVITKDLLLLENQLPYFIIEHLLNTLSIPGWDGFRLQKAAIRVFSMILPQQMVTEQQMLPEQGFPVDHLLHLSHKWISNILKLEKDGEKTSKTAMTPHVKKLPSTFPTTTALVEAGINVEVSQACSFLHVSFCKNKGVLKIPAIAIRDSTNLSLANLVAFEQSCYRHGNTITNYLIFLDNMISTRRDLELLCQKGIVDQLLRGDESIVSLINNLGRGVFYRFQGSYLEDVHKDLHAYCQSRWPKWRAKATHDYFSSPWAIISVGAGILLLVLAIVQTVYTITGYYKV